MKCHQRLVRESHEDGHPVPKDFSTASVREIPHSVAKEFILKYEWLGNTGTTVRAFGLFFGEELAAVECFGHPGSTAIWNICGEENADMVYWLARGACAHWAPPRSASSYLINRACEMMGAPWKTRDGKDMPAKFVFLATADSDAGEIGTVYQASNWIYLGKTTSDRMFKMPNDPPERAKSYRVLVKGVLRNRTGRSKDPDPDGRHFFLVDGTKYYHGDTLPTGEILVGSEKYPFKVRPKYGTTMKEAERVRLQEVLAEGYEEIKGNKKHLYVGIYGDKRLKRKLRAALTREGHEYPKRGSVEGNVVGTTNEDEVRSLGAAPTS
jgi:hypothetical protein